MEKCHLKTSSSINSQLKPWSVPCYPVSPVVPANAGQAQALDDLLWTFRDGSFVPHELYSPGAAEPAPVVIGCDPDPQLEPDVLINLAEAVPPCFSRFQRLAELVDADPARREASRELWRFYRDRGYPLQKHDL